MKSATDLQASIQESDDGITLAELLTQHPNIARRTAQRQIAKLVKNELVSAQGQGRARRYFAASKNESAQLLGRKFITQRS